MNPETEAFLESVRDAEDPTLADEARVLRAVQVTVAAGAVVGSAAATAKLTRFGAWSVSGGFKGGALVGVLAIGGLAAAHWGAAGVESAPTAAVFSTSAARPATAARPALAVRPALAAPAALPVPLASERVAPPAVTAGPALRARTTQSVASAVARPASAELREELAVLARAQAALRRGDGAAALGALDAAPPGQSQLAAERATLRILALCALGRVVEARRVAGVLERSEPGSLQRDVISRSCAGGAGSPR